MPGISESLPAPLGDVLELLQQMPDRADRIDALISVADRYEKPEAQVGPPPYDDRHKVPGCESEVYGWLLPGRQLVFAVMNPQGISAQALAVLLSESLSGQPREVFQSVSDEVVFRLFGNELSMGKSMGLTGMVRMARELGVNDRSAADAS